MHDTVFAKEIRKIVTAKLDELAGKADVTAINVKLSPFSHVKPETLKEAYGLEVKGTRLKNIPLNVNISEVEMECRVCKAVFFVTAPVESCRKCNSHELCIKPQPEFLVESIELNT